VLTLVGAALAACSGAVPPAPALDVALVQQRGDIVAERVQLRVTNTSAEAVTLTGARLSSAVLEGAGGGETARPVTIEPGRTTDLPVPLPPVRCGVGDAAAEADLRVDDGRGLRDVTAAVRDQLGVLARLSAAQCDRDALSAVAVVAATAVTPGIDGFAGLVLSIDPVSIDPAGEDTAGSLVLEAVRGTPLLRFAGGDEAPLALTVTRGDASSTVTVPVTPIRCDAHAIAEDKVGTRFDLVAVVEGREIVVPLQRSDAVAAGLLAFVAETCGLTP